MISELSALGVPQIKVTRAESQGNMLATSHLQ